MNNRWMARVAARVLANALAGGVLFALLGALCIGSGGWLTGAIIDFSGVTGEGPVYARQGAQMGVYLGVVSGVVGVLVFGIAALKAAPGELFAPLRALGGRVALGQVLGTLGAATFFFLFEAVQSHLQSQPFGFKVFGGAILIMFGAPVLMICGAIAGALSKRPARQSATLKAE